MAENINEEKKPEEEVKEENIQAQNDVQEETKEASKSEKKEKKNKYKEQIEQLQNELASMKDKYLRNLAEFENFKKRMNEEKIKDRKYASMDLIGDLIVPLDNFSRVCAMPTNDENLKNFLIGFKMIDTQIFDVLVTNGLSKIESVGKPFDPKYHQAVDKEHKDDIEPGIVLEELQKGYMYKDRVLRPAMVKVSE